MKRNLRRFLSLLLAAMLLLTAAPAALAGSDAAASVTLNQNTAVLYIRDGEYPSLRLTATANPRTYEDFNWAITEGTGNATLSERYGSSVTIHGVREGRVEVTVYANYGSKNMVSDSCFVEIIQDTVVSNTLNRENFSIGVGETAYIIAGTRYRSGEEVPVTSYSSSNTNIVRVNSDGELRGVTAGVAWVDVVYPDGERKTVNVIVGGGSSGGSSGSSPYYGGAVVYRDAGQEVWSPVNAPEDLYTTARVGTPLSLAKVYAAISNNLATMGGRTYQAVLELPHVGNANYGYLYETEDQRVRVENGYEGHLSDLDLMVFVPGGEGNYVIDYRASDNGYRVAGSITIEVSVRAQTISFVVDELENYRFSSNSKDGSSATRLISDAVGSYGSFRFGEITAGATAGTLYRNSTQSIENLIGSGSVVSASKMADLTFVPSRPGVFRINYTAYSGSDGAGNVVSAGALAIAVGSNSLDVTVTLDDANSYRFDSATHRNAVSAASLLKEAVDAAVGSNGWNYIRFEQVSGAGSKVGALYARSGDVIPVNPDNFIAYQDIDSLYFEPEKAGTFQIGYGVYSKADEGALLASGKLSLVVPNAGYSSTDVAYSTVTGGTVRLDEADFEAWLHSMGKNDFSLSHVVFNEYERDFGTFFYDGANFVPYNSADYYTSAFAEGSGVKSRRLNLVSYTAPRTSGVQAVRFTAYGYSGTGKSLVNYGGVLYIFVTSGEVPAVSYTVSPSASMPLRSEDFSAAYRSAMNASAVPQFYIQLLSVPEYGSLTYNGSRITSGNRESYSFYVNSTNGGAGRNTVDSLSYSAPAVTGAADSLRYVAYNAGGTELYAGEILFRGGSSRTISCTSEGHSFSSGDFDKALRYVSFRAPAEGRLCANYANGRGTEITPDTRFYFTDAAEGSFPIHALTYIPRAGSDQKVVLDYTACDAQGRTYTDSVTMLMAKKTASGIFSDVTAATVGTWAADSIDFAYRWGLIKGTSVSGPAAFSPSNNMQRCDLALILYRIAGSPLVSGSLTYPDVYVSDYYYDSALWASRNNIFAGILTEGRYDPHASVSREDFATMLYNFTRATGTSVQATGSLSGYQDANQVSAYALDAVLWAVSKGYITSTSTTVLQLSPSKVATRAEIATLLHRYLTY